MRRPYAEFFTTSACEAIIIAATDSLSNAVPSEDNFRNLAVHYTYLEYVPSYEPVSRLLILDINQAPKSEFR